jgi:UPF0755 protein
MKTNRFLLIAVAIALAAFAVAYLSTPDQRAGEGFTVAAGEPTDVIVRHLKSAGVIRSELIFAFALRNSGLASRLQPGSYDLRGSRTYDAVIRALSRGGVAADERQVRVIEGWTLAEIKDALLRAGYADAADLYAITGAPAKAQQSGLPDFSSEFDVLVDKPRGTSLEGYMFPDTYRFFADATDQDIVRAMLANFANKFSPELRTAARSAGRSIFDTIIIASIVEREVRDDADRAKVADLFWRRLDVGMPLQADSTVNYVTGKDSPSASAEDIAVDSPYNTYAHRGLPPGPISNPGLASLTAAARPEPNAYWYFLTDKEGTVYYAKTYDEHLRNRRTYLGR